ncbi:MAG: tRNA glutamyl-Q(34) synthetase GluQRS [Rhodospirillaceae bacterium]|nr:MAG: tRNA glutamyl-Q(34) synthetase GluQRS [Rhodospirillaceae bacterium]
MTAPAGPPPIQKVTRFAPSPTGLLHLGHAYAAHYAAHAAGTGGRFLLRLEDIDRGRCRTEFEAALLDDLAWLGLRWEQPVRRQSEHFPDYERGLRGLRDRGLVYPCFCTRAEVQREMAAAAGAPHQTGPDGPIYPGTCRHLTMTERQTRMATGTPFAWRLDMAAARAATGVLTWHDARAGDITATPEIFGDVVIARKDIPTSYHLACTWDDALQGVTTVTRGTDLFQATHIHRLLQALLDLPAPDYDHHPLILGPDGRKFSKRDKAPTLRALREAGHTPDDVIAMANIS